MPKMLIGEALLQSIARTPDAQALVVEGRGITFRELQVRVDCIRKVIAGKVSGEPVVVLAHQHIDTYASILAILSENGTYVPLAPNAPQERQQAVIDQVAPSIILTSGPAELNLKGDHIIISTMECLEAEQFAPRVKENLSTFAYILFTSGSTGVPKGVPITRANLHAFFENNKELYTLSSNDRVLQMFDLTFDLSVVSFMQPWLSGACVVVPNRGRIKAIEVLKALEANQVTHALMVPTIIQQLQPFLSQVTLPHLKLSQFCGEGLPYEACKNWANCLPNAKVQNVYGPTEATIYCTSYDCDFASDVKTYHGIICMGEPFGSNQCRVNLGTSKDRFEGELILGGPQLSPGYYKNEKQTELVFYETESERVYRTGDVVFRDDEGKLYFVGRNDQQVQIQGHRVELGEIEEACRSCGANTAVAVMVEVKNSARVVVYINEFEGADVLEKRLSSHLPEYMLPHQVQVLEIFPLNNNGKIDRKVLKERGLS